MITVAALIAAGIEPTQAKAWVTPLSVAAEHFQINTPPRVAAWVSQCAHESAGFSRLEESLFYRQPERIRAMFPSRVPSLADAALLVGKPEQLANRVYSNRLGNGDEASGDGWRYRGRGLIQLTGRANYQAAGAAIDQPYERCPHLLTQPLHAATTAAWFFVTKGCLPLADAANVEAITRVINGPALAGLDDRRERFDDALRAFA